jgi:hypothetical protein
MYFCIYCFDLVFLKVIDRRIYYLTGCTVAVLVNYSSLFEAYYELEVAVLAWAKEIVMVLGVSSKLRLMLLLEIFEFFSWFSSWILFCWWWVFGRFLRIWMLLLLLD